ncbi:MAG: PASTA domain-containing protein [Bacilli bacterium]|nr:PASTA domain-containing protein [Bacilli bacterium]
MENKKEREGKHYFVHGILILLLLFSIGYFIYQVMNPNSSIMMIIKELILTIFIICYVIISITYKRYHKTMIFIGSMLLFFVLGLNLNFNTKSSKVESVNFTNKDVAEVIQWSLKNHISVEQVYEYSDVVSEYHVIYQDYDKKKKQIIISISEGVNPYKEIMIPSMISWNSDQVLEFVKKNHLSHVEVDYVSSDQAKDTVIEQNVTGSFRRNDLLKLVFSYGEELGFQQVSMMDLTNKSQFEVELYMKKNQLRYEIVSEFSDSIKSGYVIKQSIPSGEMVSINDTRIKVTLSRGKMIKIIDFKDYDVRKITDWAIQNKMKIHFLEQYDDSKAKGTILSVSPVADSEVEQGSSIDVTLSKGPLKMPKFKELNSFLEWANKNHITVREEHEFNRSVKAGEVIRYSYKEGEIIKNQDVITVTISDGSKKTVPNLLGLKKEEAIKKLEDLELHYNFIYEDSEGEKDIVLNQSILPDSEISMGITITITLSN